MKIRMIALALTVLLAFAACGRAGDTGGASAPEPSPAAGVETMAGRVTVSQVTLAVSRDAEPELIEAAEAFVAELTARTNGALTAGVELTIAPDAALLSGRAQIALLNKRRQFDFCQSLAATATPFLYTGFENFLMRANARDTMRILAFSLREDHGLIPLTAFYQGSNHLLIDFAPGGYQQFEGTGIILSEDAQVAAAFGRLVGTGGVLTTYDTDEARMEQFILGEGNAAELSMETFAALEEDFPYQVHLIAGYHNLVPAWLVADADFMDNLPPHLRAQVIELSAYMSARIGWGARERELAVFRSLEDKPNIAIVRDFTSVRNRIFNTLPVLDEEATERDRLARDLLGIMRGIA
ncbi:MAG: hypothetical protein FWE32_09530 [Oscillospiraceae bacterium]|nr:hypothetical protein [Oscillospiraceae bacterium]